MPKSLIHPMLTVGLAVFLSLLWKPVSVISQNTLPEASQNVPQATDPLEKELSIIKSQLKEITEAMFSYNRDEHFHMPPPAEFDKVTGIPLLSWRVLLLPYLNQNDLFKQFKLDEAWDSNSNKKLLGKMPKVFAHPISGSAQKGETHYRLFVAPFKAPKGKSDEFRPAYRWDPNQKLTYREITEKDGISQTLLIAETTDPVPWTKPDEIMIEHDEYPLPQFGAIPKSPVFVAITVSGDTYLILKRTSKMTISNSQYDRLLRQFIGFSDGTFNDLNPILKEKQAAQSR